MLQSTTSKSFEPHLQGAPSDTFAAMRDTFSVYHECAAASGLDGVLVLFAVRPNLEEATDGQVKPREEKAVHTFEIGDVETMIAKTVELSNRGFNVWFSPAIVRRDLPRHSRGTKGDIVAVLGLVIDDDGDTGKRALRPPIPSTFEITTSTVPAVNFQVHYTFSRALPPDEAATLAELLHKKCGGDHGTKDIAHVWRPPETLNYPTASKIARNRPVEPQEVRLSRQSATVVDPDALRRVLEPLPDCDPPKAKTKKRTGGNGNGGNGHAPPFGAIHPDDLPIPDWLLRDIQTEDPKDRSAHSCKTMLNLMKRNIDDEAICYFAHKGEFANKFVERGDLDAEIERVRKNVWTGEVTFDVIAAYLRKQQGHSSNGSSGNGTAHANGRADGDAGGTTDEDDDGDLNVRPWPVRDILESKAASGIVGDIARLATAHSEADPIGVIASTLAWSAASFGRKTHYCVGDTNHHSRIFTVLVGESSRARKGTSFGPVERIFRQAERTLHGRQGLIFPANLPLNVAHGLSTGEGLTAYIRDKRNDDDQGYTDDKRLFVVESEFGAVLRHFQRQGNTLSAVLRAGWDGCDLGVMTKNDRDKATDPHVCILGHITIGELMLLLNSVDISNGLANRFMWIAVRRGKNIAHPTPMPEASVLGIAKDLADVIEFAHKEKSGRRIQMTNEAAVHWGALYPELTQDNVGKLGAATSRAEAQVLRVAMTYAQLEGANFIEFDHLEAAMSFWRYAFDSAAYIFGDAELNPIAQKIWVFLETPRTQAEIVDLFARNLSKDQLGAVLADMQSRGRITMEEVRTGKPGRPRKVWSRT